MLKPRCTGWFTSREDSSETKQNVINSFQKHPPLDTSETLADSEGLKHERNNLRVQEDCSQKVSTFLNRNVDVLETLTAF